MKLATILFVAIVAWILATYARSYEALAAELRRVRAACMGAAADAKAPPAPTPDGPITAVRDTMLRALSRARDAARLPADLVVVSAPAATAAAKSETRTVAAPPPSSGGKGA